MQLVEVPLDRLEAHPNNSNVMREDAFHKLVRHISESDQYPPLIVRPLDEHGEAIVASATEANETTAARYQILDGHHRAKALEQLGRTTARCVVWPVDDDKALMLLATLNRLEGQDDPTRRAALLEKLSQRHDWATLQKALPDHARHLRQMLQANHQPPKPASPPGIEQMPEALHFFLYPEQRRAVEAKLGDQPGTRAQKLLRALGLFDQAAKSEA